MMTSDEQILQIINEDVKKNLYSIKLIDFHELFYNETLGRRIPNILVDLFKQIW